ncbi:cell pattern formation-associated protein stuA [Podospora fimiseda]|uniref:Cell pattern formation-associated protein stuA n=1 Tax=Podospora fimiseda TaxID=252190 RepID=A0AAN7BVC2_9PEZI|nr:cell pattern formation-associated protein stuA [Podospora fimiseda]
MNQGATEMYYAQQSHMSAGQPPPPQTVTSHYPHQHQQPPVLQPGPGQYSQAPYASHYAYGNGLTSPPTGPPVSNGMGTGAVLPLPGGVNQQGMSSGSYTPGYDTTGQVAPPGMKPRVTATLWEDEGSLCFQVEARGICVARREDNHMINGTKLLNVAGMTRGRRDGILKSEKVRHVVKIGPMHLKGVWIPFDRALEFANKEKITELLYPLFVHNIGQLLYHPANQSRANQVLTATAERRKQGDMRGGQPPSGLPSIGPHHHHSMSLPGPQAPLPSHPSNMARPSLDRANTFPTPPTSASSVIGPMGASDNFQQWGHQSMNNGQPNQISIDTTLSNQARSLPTTPATTPPGSTLQSMQSYPPASQPYEGPRQMYQTTQQPSQQSSYAPANSAPQDNRPMYAQGPYVKSEMAPPSGRTPGPSNEQPESKPPANGMMHVNQGEQAAPSGQDEEAEHEHDGGEYTHDSGAYNDNRGSYNYSAPPVASLPNEHSHLSPEISGSPHQSASGRATPRTAPAPQSYYTQPGYNTPPRVSQNSSSLYNVISNERSGSNGPNGAEVYPSQNDMNSMSNGYASQPPVLNGGAPSMKRSRDDDDERPGSGGPGMSYDTKRRKTTFDGASMPSPTFNPPMAQTAPPVGAAPRRR